MRMMDEAHTVDVIYLDFVKDFDPVNHRLLVAKMKSFSLGDVVVRWSWSRECTSGENSLEPFQCAVVFRKAP